MHFQIVAIFVFTILCNLHPSSLSHAPEWGHPRLRPTLLLLNPFWHCQFIVPCFRMRSSKPVSNPSFSLTLYDTVSTVQCSRMRSFKPLPNPPFLNPFRHCEHCPMLQNEAIQACIQPSFSLTLHSSPTLWALSKAAEWGHPSLYPTLLLLNPFCYYQFKVPCSRMRSSKPTSNPPYSEPFLTLSVQCPMLQNEATQACISNPPYS
jgi:hypothetical protein